MATDENAKNPGFTNGKDLRGVKPSDYPQRGKSAPQPADGKGKAQS